MESNQSRRQFLKGSMAALVAIPVYALLGRSWSNYALAADALPAGMNPVSESDPVAMALGYKSDVKRIDYKKYPKRKEAAAKYDFCKNCALYTKQNESWGKCQMLVTGVVSANGWCGSFNKKPS